MELFLYIRNIIVLLVRNYFIKNILTSSIYRKENNNLHLKNENKL